MARKRPSRSAKPYSTRPTASEVAPGVFVGGWGDATKFVGTRFCVLDERPEEDLPAVTHLPIYDPTTDRPIRANLERLAGLAEAARQRNEPVLFFCGHGIRRGPLAAAWFLHEQEKIPLDEAYRRIRMVRPRIETPEAWIGDAAELSK
ncbi:MAG TPA: hypothetical protein VJQ43_04370 [Thermoplasmata archaeon]|nr:hypothetical protein [Thermoplasmata archaeon]